MYQLVSLLALPSLVHSSSPSTLITLSLEALVAVGFNEVEWKKTETPYAPDACASVLTACHCFSPSLLRMLIHYPLYFSELPTHDRNSLKGYGGSTLMCRGEISD